MLVLFIIGGGFLLEKLGISLRSFQIAGGIILFLVALAVHTVLSAFGAWLGLPKL